MLELEKQILNGLVVDEDFLRAAVPHLKPEYFTDNTGKYLFAVIKRYINKYNACPSYAALRLDVDGDKTPGISQQLHDDALAAVEQLRTLEHPAREWLLDKTEKHVQERAIYNAILESIEILDGKHKTFDKGAIPTLLTDALGVCFDSRIGHDYINDAEDRFQYYNLAEHKIPFRLKTLNTITCGGFSRKTLNVWMAGTYVGKTLLMCSLAADALLDGHNVLYITLEVAEREIARRIDANLLNVSIGDVKDIPKSVFDSRIKQLHNKTKGKLVVREYPTSSATTHQFRALINELKLKQNFTPDVIFVDYINNCASARIKTPNNMYQYYKSIAEEIRALAIETNTVIHSATQLNRSGATSSDPEITDQAESWGIPWTVDFAVILTQSDDLKRSGRYACKQVKNRYRRADVDERFLIGVDKDKMRIYDLEQPQVGVINTEQTSMGGEVQQHPKSLLEKFATFDN